MKSKLIIRVTVLAAAVLMIIFGINGGGVKDVLGRAVMICLECIGVGS